MRHLLSLLRSPLGYVANLIATCHGYVCDWPGMAWLDADPITRTLCAACETFCARDGVQDDVLF